MNYQEMETMFREEQRSLDRQLHLSLSAVDLKKMGRDWWMVRRSAGRMQAGGWADKLTFSGSLFIIYLQPESWLAYLPFIAWATSLLINLNFFPFRPLPKDALERFTTAELAREVARLRQYVSKRNLFDLFGIGLWLFTFYAWYYSWQLGVNLVENPEELPPFLRNLFLGGMVFFVIAGNLMTLANIQQLRKVEEKLKGFYEDEYV
ncbi:MAG: hypothetical protein AAFN92_05355 [Bacteroidota bacterium]